MAVKKKTIQRKRKTYKRGPTNRGGVVVPYTSHAVIKGPNPIADQYQCTLTYSQEFTLTSTLGVSNNYVWRANSVYDVNYTSGSILQPRCFDQLSALYHRYMVTGVSYEIDFIPKYTNGVGAALSVTPHTTILTGTPIEHREAQFNKFCIVGIPNASGQRKLQGSLSVSKLFGVGYIRPRDEQYTGPVTDNPSKVGYINVSLQAIDQSTTVALEMVTRLRYNTIFYDRKLPAAS